MPNNLIVIDRVRWFPENRGGSTWSAKWTCPECGRHVALGNQVIDGIGIVYPAVSCPWNRRTHPELKEQMDHDDAIDCNFRGQIRLDQWPPKIEQLTQPPGQLI